MPETPNPNNPNNPFQAIPFEQLPEAAQQMIMAALTDQTMDDMADVILATIYIQTGIAEKVLELMNDEACFSKMYQMRHGHGLQMNKVLFRALLDFQKIVLTEIDKAMAAEERIKNSN